MGGLLRRSVAGWLLRCRSCVNGIGEPFGWFKLDSPDLVGVGSVEHNWSMFAWHTRASAADWLVIHVTQAEGIARVTGGCEVRSWLSSSASAGGA